jgi:hypothetical protein
MDLHYNVRSETISKDGEIRFVGPIEVPEPWAIAYHWSDGVVKGIIEGGGTQREFFDKQSRIQFLLAAFDAAPPITPIIEPLYAMPDPGDNKTAPPEEEATVGTEEEEAV